MTTMGAQFLHLPCQRGRIAPLTSVNYATECCTMGEYSRFVKSVRQLKQAHKRVSWRCKLLIKSMQILLQIIVWAKRFGSIHCASGSRKRGGKLSYNKFYLSEYHEIIQNNALLLFPCVNWNFGRQSLQFWCFAQARAWCSASRG